MLPYSKRRRFHVKFRILVFTEHQEVLGDSLGNGGVVSFIQGVLMTLSVSPLSLFSVRSPLEADVSPPSIGVSSTSPRLGAF